eukprot:1061692-Prymnesium_polylepis.2
MSEPAPGPSAAPAAANLEPKMARQKAWQLKAAAYFEVAEPAQSPFSNPFVAPSSRQTSAPTHCSKTCV